MSILANKLKAGTKLLSPEFVQFFQESDILAKDKPWLNDLAEIRKDKEKYKSLMNDFRDILDKKDGTPLRNTIQKLKQKSKISKAQFLNHDLSKLKTKPENYVTFLHTITGYYQQFSLFPDEEIIDRFRFWGIPRPQLKWMIPIDEILNELNELGRNEKFILSKTKAFLFIQQHLYDKIFNQIFSWGIKTTPKKTEIDLAKYSRLFFRRLKDGNGKLKKLKNPGEDLLQNIFSVVKNQYSDFRTFQTAYMNKVEGKTEKTYLMYILAEGIPISDISEADYLRSFFNLFRTICKDKKLLSEEQFDDRVKQIKSRRDKSFYDGDYNFYKARIVKKLILKK